MRKVYVVAEVLNDEGWCFSNVVSIWSKKENAMAYIKEHNYELDEPQEWFDIEEHYIEDL